MRRQIRILIVNMLLLGLIIWAFWIGYQNSRRQKQIFTESGYRQIMGTFAQIKVAAPTRQQAVEWIGAALKAVEQIQDLMNDRDEDSEISNVNENAFKKEVVVSEELFEVLMGAREISILSGGAFDVTIGAQTDLWRGMQLTGEAPTPEQIQLARSRVGYQRLILNPQNRSVRFETERMRLDLGAIAKGYAIDQAVQILLEKGATGGMIDIGGDIRCFGIGPGRQGEWIIGLQDPRDEEQLLATFRLNEMAVATSGDYRRYAEIEGKKISHILDPLTAQSADELISVTILAPTTIQADSLATAVSVLGKQRGLDLIESLDHVEALLVSSDNVGELVKSSGAHRYLTQMTDP